MPTFKQLKHLRAVIQHGSINRAAEAIHVTPPALTRSLNILEDELGVPLFDRCKSGMQPTEFCRQIQQRLERLLVDSEDFVREAHLYRQLETGRLNIGIGRAIREFVLRPVVPDFVVHYPKVQVHISEGLPEELIYGLRTRQYDLAITDASGLLEIDGLNIRHLKNIPTPILARPGHPFQGEQGVALRKLFAYPMLAATELMSTHPIRRIMAKPTGSSPEVHLLSSDYELLKQTLLCSDAWMPAPISQFSAEIEAGSMVVLDVPSWKFTAEISAIELQGRAPSPASERFVELCQQRKELW